MLPCSTLSSNIFLIFLDWNSALFIILNGTKQEHLNMLDGGIIQRLLEEKWKTFARVCNYKDWCHFDLLSVKNLILSLLQTKFLKRLLILMLHLLLLSVSVYLRHSAAEAEANPDWGLEVFVTTFTSLNFFSLSYF